MTDPHWTECQFLRFVSTHSCVVRLVQTGATLQLALTTPLDVANACLACPTKPVPCRVRLAEDLDRGYSELQIDWPAGPRSLMPPPERFIRKSRAAPRKLKRQKRG